MTMTIKGYTIALDGNPAVPAVLHVEPAPVEYIRSYTAVLPDPEWLHEDRHGHLHVWTETGRKRGGRGLPSLVESRRHVDCDGSCGDHPCEGYEIPVWHCADCGDEVEPGFIPDHQARTVGLPFETGPREMSAMVAEWPLGPGTHDLSGWHQAVLTDPGGREHAMRAVTGDWRIDSYGDEHDVQVTIHLTPTADQAEALLG